MLTELLYQLILQLLLPPHQPILLLEEPQLSTPDLLLTTDMLDTHMLTTLESVKPIAKLTQLSTSSEEPQSPLSVDLPPMLTELLSQLMPQLSPLPPLNILLPKELQSSMTSLSLPQSITDMLDTHMLTTLESVKPKAMPMLTMAFLDTDMVSNMSQLSHL